MELTYYQRNREKKIRQAAEWAARNPEKRLAIMRRWNKENPERKREHANKYARRVRAENPEAARKEGRDYYNKNREARIASVLRYIKRNPHKNAEGVARYRARCKRATPAWRNTFFINEIYDLAQLRTRLTGKKWTVDHAVPLKHDLVSGLHCEQNLQVILHSTNSAKRNFFWPDMPE